MIQALRAGSRTPDLGGSESMGCAAACPVSDGSSSRAAVVEVVEVVDKSKRGNAAASGRPAATTVHTFHRSSRRIRSKSQDRTSNSMRASLNGNLRGVPDDAGAERRTTATNQPWSSDPPSLSKSGLTDDYYSQNPGTGTAGQNSTCSEPDVPRNTTYRPVRSPLTSQISTASVANPENVASDGNSTSARNVAAAAVSNPDEAGKNEGCVSSARKNTARIPNTDSSKMMNGGPSQSHGAALASAVGSPFRVQVSKALPTRAESSEVVDVVETLGSPVEVVESGSAPSLVPTQAEAPTMTIRVSSEILRTTKSIPR